MTLKRCFPVVFGLALASAMSSAQSTHHTSGGSHSSGVSHSSPSVSHSSGGWGGGGSTSRSSGPYSGSHSSSGWGGSATHSSAGSYTPSRSSGTWAGSSRSYGGPQQSSGWGNSGVIHYSSSSYSGSHSSGGLGSGTNTTTAARNGSHGSGSTGWGQRSSGDSGSGRTSTSTHSQGWTGGSRGSSSSTQHANQGWGGLQDIPRHDINRGGQGGHGNHGGTAGNGNGGNGWRGDNGGHVQHVDHLHFNGPWRTGFDHCDHDGRFRHHDGDDGFGFFFGFYAFSPISDCVVSPWYYYPTLPAYIPCERVVVVEGTRCPWGYGSSYSYSPVEDYNSYGNPGLNYAINRLTDAFQRDDTAALGDLVPQNGEVAIYTDGQYMYSLNANDFFHMLEDNVHNTHTTSYRITSVRTSNSGAQVTARHEFQDPEGNLQVIYHQYRLQNFNGDFVITDFTTSHSPITNQNTYF